MFNNFFFFKLSSMNGICSLFPFPPSKFTSIQSMQTLVNHGKFVTLNASKCFCSILLKIRANTLGQLNRQKSGNGFWMKRLMKTIRSTQKFKWSKKNKFVPGLLKIFDNILLNAVAQKLMTELHIDIDTEISKISIRNNGNGIAFFKRNGKCLLTDHFSLNDALA